MEVLEKAIIKVLAVPVPKLVSVRKRIHKMLEGIPDNKIYQISWEVRRGQQLETRSRESVEAFLLDAAARRLQPFPHIERLDTIVPNRARSSLSSLLRQRELGSDSRRSWAKRHRPGENDIRDRMFDTFGPAYRFTGMSNDVLSVAWHPDGQRFAAGAACVVDSDSMQYNRPNNLLLGDTIGKSLRELPEHHIIRQKAKSGVNSQHSMHVSQDPRLFTTISMVEFSQDGHFLFSAGYDKNVRVYTSRPDRRELSLLYTLKHKAPVDLLATNKAGHLATACQRDKNPIKLLRPDAEKINPCSFESQKATERVDLRITPKALKFEPTYGELLLAGFGANAKEDGLDTVGEICLWNVETKQRLEVYGGNRNVFDLAFNPHHREGGLFAVGCVAGTNSNRGANSVVRFYDLRTKYSMFMELELSAMDLNDVVYCPYDEVYFAAGCTDGKTYVWDIRNPNSWLYTLSHGEPLTPLDRQLPREMQDTGIRFCSWGDSSRRLYTGSSDGVVKSWDITHASADVFVRDIVTLNSGVMSAAFSADKTSLLIGEVNGSVNVLELGREDHSAKDAETLRLIPSAASSTSSTASKDSPRKSSLDSDSGVTIAKDLVRTRQMEIVPLGGLPIRQAVRGPAYSGPIDASEDAVGLREQSYAFQQTMLSRPDVPQCQIASCIEDIVKVTLEEVGDSGRSKDRIPDSLRSARKPIYTDTSIVPGKSKCSDCGRPARPSEGGKSEPLCERCGFDCLYCGNRAVVADETDVVWCMNCDRRWDIGSLGYEPVGQHRLQK
jgi:WD40 repeat protein